MTTDVEGLDTERTSGWRAIGQLAMRTIILMLSIVIFVTFHEYIHLIVGRAVGLPAAFLSLTSVGVGKGVAEQAPPLSVALMNGVAPFVTIVMGFITLWLLMAVGHRMPYLLSYFLAWWAIFGVPYVGVQMMFSAGVIHLDGSGDDFAAVFAGYFGFPQAVMTLITVVGLAIFILTSFWLWRPLALIDGMSAQRRFRWKDLHIVPTAWRRYSALIIGVLTIVWVLISGVRVAQGDQDGSILVIGLLAPTLWIVVVALLVPWRTAGAKAIRNRWVWPSVAASILFFLVGLVVGALGDYTTLGPYTIAPVVTTAWVLAGATPRYEEK